MVAFGQQTDSEMLISNHSWNTNHQVETSLAQPHPGQYIQPNFMPNNEDHYNKTSFGRGRRQREFIPEAKKDDCYWDRRRRNNEAAKRSREKRRLNDMILEGRVVELTKENWILKAQIQGVFDNYGIRASDTLSPLALDQIIAAVPSNDQILALESRVSRPDSYCLSPPPSIPSAKRPRLSMCKTEVTDVKWPNECLPRTVSESDEDSWEAEEHSSENWGPLNLSKLSESDSCSVPSSSNSPRSNEQNSLPTRMLPHKLRFKHSFEENSISEESSN